MKYFVIGERELVLAFSLVGVKGTVAVNRDGALDAFNQITGKGTLATATPAETTVPVDSERPKVLIITEEVAVMLEEEVLQWQMSGNYPLIVEIPGIQGHMTGKKTLTESIREAIGIRV